MARINANRGLSLRARFGLGGPASAGVLDQSVTDNVGAVQNDGSADSGTSGRPDLTQTAVVQADTADKALFTPAAHATDILAKAQHGYPVLWISFGDNKTHGSAVTVTGIAVGDVITAIVKLTTTAGAVTASTNVAITDGVIGAGTVTFTATDLDTDDILVLQYLDRT